MIRLQREPFAPGDELARFTGDNSDAGAGAGAIVSFVGLVRGGGEAGAVGTLELDHHPRFTIKVMAEIEAAALARFAIRRCLIVHRYGVLSPGEPIVFVATAVTHRRAAFEAADYLMDRLKTEAPFWKRERGPGGERWIEARPSDHADRARWD